MKRLVATVLAPMLVMAFGALSYAADAKGAEKAAAPAAAVRRTDINSATEEQLKALPGVGADGAKRIVAGRPYYQKEELKTKKVVPADTYEQIKSLIRALC